MRENLERLQRTLLYKRPENKNFEYATRRRSVAGQKNRSRSSDKRLEHTHESDWRDAENLGMIVSA